jgi:hypothetical protein
MEKKDYPKGWEKFQKFVDVDGNYYNFGTEMPENKGKYPPTEVKNRKGDIIYPPTDVTNSFGEESVAEIPAMEAEPKSSKNTEMITISKSELEKIVNDNIRSMLKSSNHVEGINPSMIDKLVAGITKKDVEFNSTTKSISKEDFEPSPPTFYMVSQGFWLSAYKNSTGAEVIAPLNSSVKFEKRYDEIVKGQKGTPITIPIATCNTHSKKEIEFIKNSPFMNLTIFEGGISVNPEMMEHTQIVSSVALWLAKMGNDDIIKTATELGYPNLSIDEMRKKVAEFKVSQEIGRSNISSRRIQEQRVNPFVLNK